ncbi:MAG: undecaprenyl-phosphate glucose phosphotransferase [Bacteroidetes bacterium]|nr:MAG: undecaprenyl-phosphate glucose phosphotransferase [Bacteroidota bacterium]
MQFYNNRIYIFRLIADMVVIALSLFLSVLYVNHFDLSYIKPAEYSFILYQIVSWYFIVKANDLYNDSRSKKGLANEIFKTFISVAVLAITIIFLLFFVDSSLYGPKFVTIYISLLLLILPIEKFVMKYLLLYLRRNGLNIKRVLILGHGKAAMRFYHLVQNNNHFGYTVVGFLDDELDIKNDDIRVLGKTNQLLEVIESHNIHEVIVAIPNIDEEEISEYDNKVNQAGVRMRIIPDFYHLYYNRYVVKNFGNIPVISIRKEPLEEPHWRNVKRIFDITFSALVLLLVCSWLFPIIAILIKISSPGPVFFKQKRLGKDKKEFDCYKFRSMYVNKKSDELQATKNDTRITGIGRFLRKTSLDEFPQFWNVLIGDMSVVGPRPHMLKHNIEYSKIIDGYMVRQLVKPGITGWAQVNGYRGETKENIEMINRVEHDVWYLENWFFLLDLKIIFLTFWNIFKGEEKAY